MDKQTFSAIVAENYNEIVRNFKSGLKTKGYKFDEDIMNDAFLSCYNTLKDKEITKQEALKYYWVAYINKYKTKVNKVNIIDYHEDMEEDFDDIESKCYNPIKDKIYNIIINELSDKFGVRKAIIWELYTCEGMSPQEIKKMGLDVISNFVCFSKQMKRYIKNHIIPTNRELKELLILRKDM